MPELSWVEIVAGLGGLAGLAALINSLTKASASRVDSLCKIIDAQAERIESLQAELADVRQELKHWKLRYYGLVRWIRRKGFEPPVEEEGEAGE